MSQALRTIDLDPLGGWGPWMAVIIAHPTGVAYQHQCGGVETLHRAQEGYLVPVSSPTAPGSSPKTDPTLLRGVFHAGDTCHWMKEHETLAPEVLQQLRLLVAAIVWMTDAIADLGRIELDERRTNEIREAWVPVRTPDGAGVLVWNNCD